MNRIGRALTRGVLILLLLIVLFAAGIVIAVNVSPRPFTALVNRAFATGVGIAMVEPPLHRELAPQVQAELDITYPSRYSTNRLDIFRRKDAAGPQPTILWVHGGGFIGGDKDGIETWATMIAARGYTVVSINYALAPEATYPAPLVQLGEAYRFLEQNAQRFPGVDLHRLILGGDSAGAQIAAQFAALQTNPQLAGTLPGVARISPQHLLAVILYCGPYDLRGLYNADKWFTRFFVRQLGWAYFGERRWVDTPEAAAATSIGHVTSSWPATFITDGNAGSFEADARALEASLRGHGVPVDTLYYPATRGRLGHEYQFDFSLAEALECYERTVAFLAKVTAQSRVVWPPG